MQKKNRFTLKRIAIDAVLMAVFFVLSRLSVTISGVKITFDALAVVIAARAGRPVHAHLHLPCAFPKGRMEAHSAHLHGQDRRSSGALSDCGLTNLLR